MNSTTRFVDGIRGRAFGIGVLSVGFGFVVLPTFVGRFGVIIATEILILATFAIGFNLAFGFTQLYSFGHAAFFGIGAYAFALGLQHTGSSLVLSLLIVVAASVAYAGVVGIISTRGGGIYFALLTFAFAQGLYEFVIRTPDMTGGTSGIFITPPGVPLALSLNSDLHVYYIALAVLGVTIAVGHRLLQSPFGHVMNAISQNPNRTEAIGYPVRTVRIIVFGISGLFSAFAGVLLALQSQFVRPGMLFFERSVEVIVIVILGGVGSLTGPIAGAAILVLAEQFVNDLANAGTILIGAMFITVIIFLPDGIAGQTKEIFRWVRERTR